MSKEQPTTPKRDPNKPRKMGTKEVEGVVVGRNKTVIPPEEVYRLAAMGCKDTEVADWFGIDNNTLRYNFEVELTTGREALKQGLRRAQIEHALRGNPTLLIWLGKQYLSQSDNPTTAEGARILPWIIEEEDNEE